MGYNPVPQPAFQKCAFQYTGFQSAYCPPLAQPAFQKCGFQYLGFQTLECPGTQSRYDGGGAGGSDKAGKKWRRIQRSRGSKRIPWGESSEVLLQWLEDEDITPQEVLSQVAAEVVDPPDTMGEMNGLMELVTLLTTTSHLPAQYRAGVQVQRQKLQHEKKVLRKRRDEEVLLFILNHLT